MSKLRVCLAEALRSAGRRYREAQHLAENDPDRDFSYLPGEGVLERPVRHSFNKGPTSKGQRGKID